MNVGKSSSDKDNTIARALVGQGFTRLNFLKCLLKGRW